MGCEIPQQRLDTIAGLLGLTVNRKFERIPPRFVDIRIQLVFSPKYVQLKEIARISIC